MSRSEPLREAYAASRTIRASRIRGVNPQVAPPTRLRCRETSESDVAGPLGHLCVRFMKAVPMRTSDLTARRSSMAAYASAMSSRPVSKSKTASGSDAVFPDVVEELRDVGTHGRSAAAQPDVAGEPGADRRLDAVGDADETDRRAWSCDGECRCHGLGRADAFEGGVDADPVCQLQDRSSRSWGTRPIGCVAALRPPSTCWPHPSPDQGTVAEHPRQVSCDWTRPVDPGGSWPRLRSCASRCGAR
jgi:hypothetical protein